jgi:hypothetical protein
MLHKRTVWLGITLFVTLVISTLLFASTGLAAGTGPADALLITGAPNITAPKAFTWFKFQETGQNKLVEAYLDTETPAGVLFRVYTPDSIGRWLSQEGLHPVGVSAVSPEHDFVWEGRFQQQGTYYIVVQNTTDFPVEYVLNVRGDGVTTVANIRPTATPLPNPLATPVPQGSLSGGKIVFQESSGGNIYTVNADGTNLQRLTFGLDPAWSPDGTMVAFVRQGPVPGLWLINADGRGEVNLFGGTQVRSPAWASDNEIIYSTVNRVIAGAPTCFLGVCFGGDDITRWTLFKYDLRDESTTNVNTPPTGGLAPTVNRVLGKIAFLNPGLGLMLTNLDNTGPLSIIDDDQSINTPYMSPDGSRLTYMVSQPPAYQVVVAVWDGTNPTLLTRNDPLSSGNPSNVAPTFSPDSQEILFLSNRNGKWEFFAINANGTNERQVLKNVTDQVNIQYDYSGARVASWNP